MITETKSSDFERLDSGPQRNSKEFPDSLYVMNIDPKVSDLDLIQFFGHYGYVSAIKKHRAETGTFYAYITYQNIDDGKCIDNLFT